MSATRTPPSPSALARVVGLLSSLKLAIFLLLLLASVLAAATIVETRHGRPYAQWHVYQSGWFLALLALLGVNIFFAAAVRWPWKRHQAGFVVTHAGLLVLLAGAVLTFTHSTEGTVTLAESQTATAMTLPGRFQVKAAWINRPEEAPYEFSFLPGPSAWTAGKTLDLGRVDGLQVRVLDYLPHARASEEWIVDSTGTGGPLVRVRVEAPELGLDAQPVLVSQEFGDEYQGPVRVRLQRAESPAMLEAFLNPPEPAPDGQGILLACHAGTVKAIAVKEHLGKTVPLDDKGTSVEIVAYHANARPDAHGRFRSQDDKPQNPLLELKVHAPGLPGPVRQVAAAHNPLLNLDLVYGHTCPVKFTYCHPSRDPAPAVELMQAADGRLHCRLQTPQGYVQHGEVLPGSRLPMPGEGSLTLTNYLPHTRLQLAFDPVSATDEEDAAHPAGPAAHVEVTAAGVTETVWLQSNHSLHNGRVVSTPQGPLEVVLGPAAKPLGFSLQLLKFQRDVNPGGVGNAAYASQVRVLDPARGITRTRRIAMNEPLTYAGLTFYQSSFGEPSHGMASSTFSVASDPGRWVKYAGSALICAGIAIMFFMKAYFFRGQPRVGKDRAGADPIQVLTAQVAVDQPATNRLPADLPAEHSAAPACESTTSP